MNTKSLVVFILVTLGVLLGVGGLLWQFGESGTKPIEDVAGEMRHVKGPRSTEEQPTVTIVEFSDFQCPACLSVQAPLKQILSKFEGKVTFVYRHFPLVSIHKNATLASQASEAAAMQDKFWEMHDLLFDKQAEWANLEDPRETFTSYAETLEMDKDKFVQDIDSQDAKDAVGVDVLASTRFRLSGTPTFFVNGVKVEFGQLEAKIQELIE